MPLKWKIFRAFLYLVLVAGIGMAAMILYNTFSGKARISGWDLSMTITTILIFLLISAFSIINLAFLYHYYPDRRIRTVHKVLHVVLLCLNLLVLACIACMLWWTLKQLLALPKDEYDSYGAVRRNIKRGEIILFVWFVAITIEIIFSVILRYRIRKNAKEKEFAILDSLGSH